MNKFNACRVKLDGYTFDSIAESRRYGELKLLLYNGTIHDLLVHPKYAIEVNGVRVCIYVADFQYMMDNDELVVEDTKGYKKGAAYAVFRLKKKLMLAVHGIEILETE